MSELSPLLESVLQQFVTNLQQGGIEACRAMVRDLAVEAGLADAVSDGAEAVQHEALAVQDDRSEEETVDRVLTANEAAKASTEAMSRHSFALHLLHMIEPQD